MPVFVIVGGLVRLWRRGNRAGRYAKLMAPRADPPTGDRLEQRDAPAPKAAAERR